MLDGCVYACDTAILFGAKFIPLAGLAVAAFFKAVRRARTLHERVRHPSIALPHLSISDDIIPSLPSNVVMASFPPNDV